MRLPYFFRRKKNQIQRLLDFLPIIWNGFDFDYIYTIELFKKSLERQANYLESDTAMTESAKMNAQKIRTAIRLIDKVYQQEYTYEQFELIEKLYGKTQYDFIECDDTSRFNGEKVYELKSRNENAVDDEHQKEIDKLKRQVFIHGLDMEKKAHRVLWKFIEHNIQRWWD